MIFLRLCVCVYNPVYICPVVRVLFLKTNLIMSDTLKWKLFTDSTLLRDLPPPLGSPDPLSLMSSPAPLPTV